MAEEKTFGYQGEATRDKWKKANIVFVGDYVEAACHAYSHGLIQVRPEESVQYGKLLLVLLMMKAGCRYFSLGYTHTPVLLLLLSRAVFLIPRRWGCSASARGRLSSSST